MLRYQKGAEPVELVTARTTPGMTWDGFQEREPVRRSLRKDQDALCAYCEQPLPKRFSIEHWHARAGGGPEFAWRNLLGVCDGNQGNRDLHCDRARGATALFLHPVEGAGPDPRPVLCWLGNGQVQGRSDGARRDIETLRLNHRLLVRQRLATLDGLRSLREHGWSAQKLRRHMGAGTPFRETALYWIDRHQR